MNTCIIDFLNHHPQCKTEYLQILNEHPEVTKLDILPILNLKNKKPICCGCLEPKTNLIKTMYDDQAIGFCSLECMSFKIKI